MKTNKYLRSMPTNISEFSPTAEYILGRRRVGSHHPRSTVASTSGILMIPGALGPLGDNHLVQRKSEPNVPPSRKNLIVLLWKAVGPTAL